MTFCALRRLAKQITDFGADVEDEEQAASKPDGIWIDCGPGFRQNRGPKEVVRALASASHEAFMHSQSGVQICLFLGDCPEVCLQTFENSLVPLSVFKRGPQVCAESLISSFVP